MRRLLALLLLLLSLHGAAARPRDEWVVLLGSERRPVRLSETEGALSVELLDEGRALRLDRIDWRPGRPQFRAALDGRPFAPTAEFQGDTLYFRTAKPDGTPDDPPGPGRRRTEPPATIGSGGRDQAPSSGIQQPWAP